MEHPSPDALHSPEAHEPLGGEPWSRDRARDAIASICRGAEEAFDPDRLWPVHPADGAVKPGELRSVYLGAAGMVWALDRLSRAGVHEPGRDWAVVATRLAAEADGLPPSLLLGRTGILLVSWLLTPSEETADLLALEIGANVGNETNELLWGSPGTMLAAATLFERSGEERFAELWSRSASQLLGVRDADGCWTQDLYGQTTRYLGAGHGFAGCALALLQRPDLLADGGAFAGSAAWIAVEQAVGTHETVNWPPYAGGELQVRDQTIRVQWCHGAPGIVTSLAAAEPGNEELTRVLTAGGDLTWQAGPLVKGMGLCHGTAGNGFAFLALLHRTGDERWLERARAFAMHAAARADGSRHTLWTGDMGTALLLERCLDGRWDGLPALDAW